MSIIASSASGLSPLARGTRGNLRFTLSQCPVYPRWRGEHIGNAKKVTITWRFIPAGAGNTRSVPPRHAAGPVYPRWRGEHS
ncbi:TPA: hypothetical protein J1W43_001649 [Escherichia coli]|nr:hypothetical protein [Escherichia coli]HBA8267899.1 hypothetical protein [Escherichia coli]HBA8730887.1 hypothetical protein [Escherichia coli]